MTVSSESHQINRKYKKRNKKTQKKKYIKTFNKASDEDETKVEFEAPPVGQWEPVESVNPSESEPEHGWQSYWAQHGEYLVWQVWLEKYPEYLNSDMVQIPYVKEETVENVENDHSYCCKDMDDDTCGGNQIIDSGVASQEESMDTEGIDHDSKILEESSSKIYNVSVNLHCPQNSEVNQAIRNTMISITEDQVPDQDPAAAQAETENRLNQESQQSAQMVQHLHDYCTSSTQPSTSTNSQATQACNSNGETKETLGDQWQALWDEHYMETYWYYYSQYHGWYGVEGNMDGSENISGQECIVKDDLRNEHSYCLSTSRDMKRSEPVKRPLEDDSSGAELEINQYKYGIPDETDDDYKEDIGSTPALAQIDITLQNLTLDQDSNVFTGNMECSGNTVEVKTSHTKEEKVETETDTDERKSENDYSEPVDGQDRKRKSKSEKNAGSEKI